SKRNCLCKQLPQPRDISWFSSFVSRESIESSVHIIEHRNTCKSSWSWCLHVELLSKTTNDPLPICISDSFIEEAKHSKGVNVMKLPLCLKWRKRHLYFREYLTNHADQRLPVVPKCEQLVGELGVPRNPAVFGMIGHASLV